MWQSFRAVPSVLRATAVRLVTRVVVLLLVASETSVRSALPRSSALLKPRESLSRMVLSIRSRSDFKVCVWTVNSLQSMRPGDRRRRRRTIPIMRATPITNCTHNTSSVPLIRSSSSSRLVTKFSDHLPPYRQAQIVTRDGIDLERSTLASLAGRACWWLRPLSEPLPGTIRIAPKIFADDRRRAEQHRAHYR
jgi:Transposase IS66 family